MGMISPDAHLHLQVVALLGFSSPSNSCSRSSIPPYFDLLPEYWPDDWGEEEADEDDEDSCDEEGVPEPEGEVSWRVNIEYSNHTSQEIVSYQEYLSDRPEELYLALLEYFVPEIDNLDEEDSPLL